MLYLLGSMLLGGALMTLGPVLHLQAMTTVGALLSLPMTAAVLLGWVGRIISPLLSLRR